MTLGQALSVLGKRIWYLIVAVLAAVAGALVFYLQQPVEFSSAATVSLSPTVSEALESGEVAGVTVDLDPALIPSPTVLDPAAGALGVAPESLYGSVTELAQASSTSARTLVTIEAIGGTAQQAQDRAQAVTDSYLAFLDAQIASVREQLETRRNDATAQAAALQAQVAANPDDSVAAANLTSALSTLGTVNNQLAALDVAGDPARVLSAASAGQPTGTSLTTVVLIAIALGLIVGISVALVRDHLDDRLRSEDELEQLTGRPTLGVLSFDKSVAKEEERLPIIEAPRSAVAEDLRALRTSLQVLVPGPGAVIVVTSVHPGEGKSFTSANLASAWARAGRRVLLVDGDLRKPNMSAYFPESNVRWGLSGIVSQVNEVGTAGSLLDAIIESRVENLWLLPTGGILAEPADLLASTAIESTVKHLAAQFDVVIIDTPPSLVLADASLFAAHADGVILITAIGRTLRNQIRETAFELGARGAQLIGVVANQKRRSRRSDYYAYYGYGYGYGASSGDAESAGSSPGPLRGGQAPQSRRSRRG
jgi:capsular exopolysaccharide synthesis family protein